MVHVEAAEQSQALEPELGPLVEENRQLRYLSFDLLTGRIKPDHPSYPWLVGHGATPAELDAIADRPITIEVMGLNFYPQWSTRQFFLNRTARPYSRSADKEGKGFAALITEYYERYKTPIMVTETSAAGSSPLRSGWFESSIGAIRQLRGQGVPVIGYTWFPLFTMVNWRYRRGLEPLEKYYQELGLYSLVNRSEGSGWKATPLVEQFCSYVTNSTQSIGQYYI